MKIWKTEDVTEANKNEPKVYIVYTVDKVEIKVKYFNKSDIFVFEDGIKEEDKIFIENHFRNKKTTIFA